MEKTPDHESDIRKKRSSRFGFMSIGFLFLAALFSSVDFSFLLIFGSVGGYAAFLWIYYSERPQPTYANFNRTSNTANVAGPIKIKQVLFLIAGIFLVTITAIPFLFSDETSDAGVEDASSESSDEVATDGEDFLTALQRDPNNIEALTNAGNSFYGDEKYDSALYYYNRVLQLDANNSPALYNKGLVLYNNKNYATAAELALRCTQLDAKNTDALLLLGDCYQGQDNFDLALVQYNKAYELGVREAGLSNMLAFIQDRKGNTEKAIFFYRETLQLDSSKIDVYTRLEELDPANKATYAMKKKQWDK